MELGVPTISGIFFGFLGLIPGAVVEEEIHGSLIDESKRKEVYQAFSNEVSNGNIKVEAKDKEGEMVVVDMEQIALTGYFSEDPEMIPVLEKMEEALKKSL